MSLTLEQVLIEAINDEYKAQATYRRVIKTFGASGCGFGGHRLKGGSGRGFGGRKSGGFGCVRSHF